MGFYCTQGTFGVVYLKIGDFRIKGKSGDRRRIVYASPIIGFNCVFYDNYCKYNAHAKLPVSTTH